MQPPADGPYNGTYTRGYAQTQERLTRSRLTWPKQTRAVVLKCTAIDKRGGESVRNEAGEVRMAEPDDRQQGTPIDPCVTPILISGERVSAEDKVMLQLPVTWMPQYDVAPEIDGITWYMWELTLDQPHIVRMTWSRHPMTPLLDLQDRFDKGALLLARDDDELVKDDDPRVANDTFRNGDDVPTYLEFLMLKARQQTFPSNFVVNGVAVDFTATTYCEITDLPTLRKLMLVPFANVKVVNRIEILGVRMSGYAEPGNGLVYDRSQLAALAAIHECGHAAGLEHRGQTNSGDVANPGDYFDTNAVMHYCDEGGREVNRYEHGLFLSLTNAAFWNE